jgi:DeoR/GlpR family transcriptional regulator of sugar metabolism
MREIAVLPDQRREAILDALAHDGRVVATELASRLGVSDDTLRRDLDELAAAGRLRRVRGGALPAASPTSPRFSERHGQDALAKARIAARARELLAGDDVLSLGGGTTALAVARELAAEERRRTVLTTSPDVALALSPAAGMEVLMTGGTLEHDSRTLVGGAALDAVRAVRADAAVLGACSLHPSAGLTTHCAGEAEVLRAMVAGAGRTVVVAAAAKLGHASTHVVAPASAVGQFVTEAGTAGNEPELQALREIGVEVVLA